MATRTRQIVIALSVIYLAALTGIAVYAMHSTTSYNLPIANIISAFAIALPPLAGVALETLLSLNKSLAVKGQIQTSRVFQVVVAFFLVVEASIATLAGTHIAPIEGLTCGLQERWHEMLTGKDAKSVRRIQDAFDCCGFMTPKDMAFPFSGDGVKPEACMIEYHRDRACLGSWREEERKVGILLMVVVAGVFLWKIIIILAPSSQSAWLPSKIRLPGDNHDDEGGSNRRRPRQALGYRDLESTAEPDEDSLRREVSNLNEDSHLASHVEGNRRRPTNAFGEANQWQQEHNH